MNNIIKLKIREIDLFKDHPFKVVNDDSLKQLAQSIKENPLMETQKSFLLKANQGEFLLNDTRKKRLRIKISATSLEQEMMGELK